MKKLQLSKKGTKWKGKEAFVDDDIFNKVNQFGWTYNYSRNDKKGYARNTKTNVYLHRYIWELKVGNIPKGFYVDHVDGNGLNCQIDNLRLATKSENCCNVGKQKNNTSGYKGIFKKVEGRKLKDDIYKEYMYWCAQVAKDCGKKTEKKYAKRFPYTEEGLKEAIEWQKEMEKKLHKEYAFSNRPEDTKE